MEITTGDVITWVKKSQQGTSVEFRLIDSKVVEVRQDFVVVKARNGRRRRIPFDAITKVNGASVEVVVEQEAAETIDAEEEERGN